MKLVFIFAILGIASFTAQAKEPAPAPAPKDSPSSYTQVPKTGKSKPKKIKKDTHKFTSDDSTAPEPPVPPVAH